MKQVITIKLKADCTSKQKQLLGSGNLAYKEKLNFSLKPVLEMEKKLNVRQLQKVIYDEIHSRFQLILPRVGNIPLVAIDRGLWRRIRENTCHLTSVIIKKYEGLEQPSTYVSLIRHLNDSRNVSCFHKKMSVLTLKSRIKVNDLRGSKQIKFIFCRKVHMVGANKCLKRYINDFAKQIATLNCLQWASVDLKPTSTGEVELLTTLSILSFVRKLKS